MKKRALFMLAGLLATTFAGCRDGTGFYSNVLRSDVFYQVFTISQIDFLFVVDNSLTMSNRRTILKNQMQDFVTTLQSRKAVNYQIAVVTTDLFTEGCDLADSNGLPFSFDAGGNQVPRPAGVGGTRVVKSATDPDPVKTMGDILDNITDAGDTSFWEQGLECAYIATKNHGSEFMRAGVPLGVAFFSDEDDYSCQSNCFGIQPEDNVSWVPYATTRYTNWFSNLKKSENTITAMYPVVLLDLTYESQGGCYPDPPTPTSMSVGVKYLSVSDIVSQTITGQLASKGSICTSNPPELSAVAQAFRGIARDVADRGVVFKLSSPASGNGINVFVNGEQIPFSTGFWVFDKPSNSIIFVGAYAPPQGAVVEVTYSEDVI